ncbi:Trigger factor [Candidatus Megaera polyxenophila]|nr:Trigger factor [Candidatus Megaera polyxenophila]
MNITEIKNDKTDLHLKVNIPSKEISAEIEKELARLSKDAKIDGFRVGKVPTSFLKKKYGDSLRAEAVKNKIVKAIGDITKDRNLRVLMEPEIEDIIDEESKDLEFTLKYQLFPEITIPDFKNIAIEKPVLELKDKDIDEQLEKLVSTSKEYKKINTSKAKKGDQVTIDAIGYVDGKAFAGGKLTAHKLVLGSGVFIPGFEDQLIGAKTGDDISVKVDFPKDYHEKTLAGKPSEFKVKILEVHSESEVKLDDEFAQKFKFENLGKLREQIAKNMQEVYEEPIKTMMKMALFDKLENMLKFDVPKTLLDKEIKILEKQAAEVEDKELEEKSSKDKETYFAKLALRRVKLGLMLAEYVKIHKLEIEKTDIQKAIMDQAKNFPGRENEIIDFYLKHPKALESLKGPVLEDKAVKTIFEKEVKLLEKSYSKDKLEKLLAKNANDHLPESSKNDNNGNIHEHSHEHIHDENCNHDYDHDGYVKAHKHDRVSNPETFHDHSREHNDKRDQKKAKTKK